MPTLFNCPLCSKQTFSLIKQIRHIGLYHQNEPKFEFTCGLNGCGKTFSSYRSHIYRKHRDLLSLVSEEEEACDDDEHCNSEEHTEDFHDLEEELPNTNVEDIANCREFTTEDLLPNLKRNLCLFILKLREKHCIAATVQFSIVESLQVIFQEFTTHYAEIIRFHLQQQHQIDTDADDNLSELLDQQNMFDECLQQISSEWMLEHYCEDELEYIAPVHKQNDMVRISSTYLSRLC